MGLLDGLRKTDWVRVVWTILILIPFVDKEVFASIPILREITPGTPEFYWLEMNWSERIRLIFLIVVPYVDGEVLELGGVDLETWVMD